MQIARFTQPPSVEALATHMRKNYPSGKYFAANKAVFCGTDIYAKIESEISLYTQAIFRAQTSKGKIKMIFGIAELSPKNWKRANFMVFIGRAGVSGHFIPEFLTDEGQIFLTTAHMDLTHCNSIIYAMLNSLACFTKPMYNWPRPYLNSEKGFFEQTAR